MDIRLLLVFRGFRTGWLPFNKYYYEVLLLLTCFITNTLAPHPFRNNTKLNVKIHRFSVFLLSSSPVSLFSSFHLLVSWVASTLITSIFHQPMINELYSDLNLGAVHARHYIATQLFRKLSPDEIILLSLETHLFGLDFECMQVLIASNTTD